MRFAAFALPRRVVLKARSLVGGSELKWRWVDNLAPSLDWLRHRRPLSAAHTAIVEELRANGVAMASFEEVFGDRTLLDEVVAFVAARERDQASQIEEARRHAGEIAHHKTFLFEVIGTAPVLQHDDPVARIVLHPAVFSIAEAYNRTRCRLSGVFVWRSFTMPGPAQRSQLWHRDPEDRSVVKLFVYLEDVDTDTGPFHYVPGTHPYGSRRKLRAQSFVEPNRGGRRSTDEMMARSVPAPSWRVCTGPKGSVLFVDTRGYHKGGFARTTERLVLTGMYLTKASTTADTVTIVDDYDQTSRATRTASR